MIQFSNTGKEIEIEILSGELLFIDPQYLESIVNGFATIKSSIKDNNKELVKLIEDTFFPYGGRTLLGFKTINKDVGIYKFNLSSMSYFDDENEDLKFQAVEKNITTIGIDSGSFLILDLANFEKLISLINYDDLIDLTENSNAYFEKINRKLGNKGWGYVTTPGIDSGYVFKGDGSYIIN